jgi:hypothetical protein
MTLRREWRGEQVKKAVSAEGRRALKIAGEYLLDQANQTVPHMDGILQASGEVEPDGDAVKVSYSTPYAIRLHENPQYNFLKGRRGKWLELSLGENEAELTEIIARALRGELGG